MFSLVAEGSNTTTLIIHRVHWSRLLMPRLSFSCLSPSQLLAPGRCDILCVCGCLRCVHLSLQHRGKSFHISLKILLVRLLCVLLIPFKFNIFHLFLYQDLTGNVFDNQYRLDNLSSETFFVAQIQQVAGKIPETFWYPLTWQHHTIAADLSAACPWCQSYVLPNLVITEAWWLWRPSKNHKFTAMFKEPVWNFQKFLTWWIILLQQPWEDGYAVIKEEWRWWEIMLKQLVAFEWCSDGTKWPKVCLENIPNTLTPPAAWTVDITQDGSML